MNLEFRGWVLAGASVDFDQKPRPLSLAQRDIVAFRNSQGQVFAFQRRCPHMGADLSKGCLEKDRLICPFHAWSFDSNGKCSIPTGEKSKFNLTQYTVVEKFGFVFIYLFGLPTSIPTFFSDKDESQYISSSIQKIEAEADWHMAVANSFDLAHFVHVHKRKLLQPPLAQAISDSTYEIELNYEVLGAAAWVDRLIRWTKGPEAQMIFTVTDGNLALAQVRFGSTENLMMIVAEPSGEGRSISKIVIFLRKSFLDRLKVFLLAYFSRRFFEKEAELLRGTRINWSTLVNSDKTLIEYYRWLSNKSFPTSPERPKEFYAQ